jgi:hypothetical protein
MSRTEQTSNIGPQHIVRQCMSIDPLAEAPTVPVGSSVASVRAVSSDGIFESYVVHDPRDAGQYLYIGESESDAQAAAAEHNAA